MSDEKLFFPCPAGGTEIFFRYAGGFEHIVRAEECRGSGTVLGYFQTFDGIFLRRNQYRV